MLLTIQLIVPKELEHTSLSFLDVLLLLGFFIVWVVYAIVQNWRDDS